jgi:hypothetical protein
VIHLMSCNDKEDVRKIFDTAIHNMGINKWETWDCSCFTDLLWSWLQIFSKNYMNLVKKIIKVDSGKSIEIVLVFIV